MFARHRNNMSQWLVTNKQTDKEKKTNPHMHANKEEFILKKSFKSELPFFGNLKPWT